MLFFYFSSYALIRCAILIKLGRQRHDGMPNPPMFSKFRNLFAFLSYDDGKPKVRKYTTWKRKFFIAVTLLMQLYTWNLVHICAQRRWIRGCNQKFANFPRFRNIGHFVLRQKFFVLLLWQSSRAFDFIHIYIWDTYSKDASNSIKHDAISSRFREISHLQKKHKKIHN